MEDIEDYGGSNSEDQEAKGTMTRGVAAKQTSMIDAQHAPDVDDVKASVPGTQKVYVKTYGCSHNISDSEYMEGMLADYGYRIQSDPAEADLWLVNSCTVKDPSQAAFVHLVNKGKAEGKHIVVAGCVPQGDKAIPALQDVSQVGITQIDRVVEVVESTLAGEKVQLLKKKELPSLDLPKKRKNRLVEIIPLSTGCLGSCTYCKTKHARGVLGSYSLQALVDRVKTVVAEPEETRVSEIWLTSEDTGAYGRDIGTNIGILLKEIVEVLPDSDPITGAGGVMLRVGMTNPPYILEHLEVVGQILSHPKVFAFLHVPVQAGSNRVLDAMRREYTVEEYRRVCDFLLENVPGMTIATDIICGFPTETESDFERTMTLVRDYRLAITNISQFYPRPGTPAAKMKRINTQVVKNRSRKITKLFESFTPYTHLVGQREKVWFCLELSPSPSGVEGEMCSVGHTKSYVKVIVPLDPSLPGRCRYVNIHACARFHVEGTVDGNQQDIDNDSSSGINTVTTVLASTLSKWWFAVTGKANTYTVGLGLGVAVVLGGVLISRNRTARG